MPKVLGEKSLLLAFVVNCEWDGDPVEEMWIILRLLMMFWDIPLFLKNVVVLCVAAANI